MLTDAERKNAICPPDRARARLACSGGLYLKVSPNGSKRCGQVGSDDSRDAVLPRRADYPGRAATNGLSATTL